MGFGFDIQKAVLQILALLAVITVLLMMFRTKRRPPHGSDHDRPEDAMDEEIDKVVAEIDEKDS